MDKPPPCSIYTTFTIPPKLWTEIRIFQQPQIAVRITCSNVSTNILTIYLSTPELIALWIETALTVIHPDKERLGQCPSRCVFWDISLWISEDPQTAVTIAGEDICEAIVAYERLNAPEVVACGVQVTTDFHKLAGACIRWVGALNLNCA